ncbi:MAG: CDGSH iron-sulfur domain-containing protein, partial [Proteobacteria bacterium]|nr:CDGSH iron-sulfur domain-containing protein [Pseudomonadota bacterium]
TVRVLENGPLAVRGALTVRGAAAGLRATLCRCGRSARKPYCDGSHASAGFTATGEPPVRESAPLPVRAGPLDVAPQKDGPLKLSGPVEVISGTGHTVHRARELHLCRCGHSKTKPYCDGTHRALGFVAD